MTIRSITVQQWGSGVNDCLSHTKLEGDAANIDTSKPEVWDQLMASNNQIAADHPEYKDTQKIENVNLIHYDNKRALKIYYDDSVIKSGKASSTAPEQSSGSDDGSDDDSQVTPINPANLTVFKDKTGKAVGTQVKAGTKMTAGQSISSPDGKTVLAMGTNGNLTLSKDGKQIWESATTGKTGAYAQLQENGNFAVYQDTPDANDATKTTPTVLWQMGSGLTADQSKAGAHRAFVVQDGQFTSYFYEKGKEENANDWTNAKVANASTKNQVTDVTNSAQTTPPSTGASSAPSSPASAQPNPSNS